MLLNEKQIAIIKDALRVYMTIRVEEYQRYPSFKKAQIMNDIDETLELFIHPKKPRTKKIEKIS
jgi:hypothetical protein